MSSSTFEPAQRFERIRHWLDSAAPLDADALRQMQLDDHLPLVDELLPQVLATFAAAPPKDGNARLGLTLLARWDRRFTPRSPEATLFATFLWRLHFALFADELGDELAPDYRGYPADAGLIAAVRGDLPQWVDDARTPEVEDLPQILRRAYLDAVARLVEDYGTDPAEWRWGRFHTLTLQHPFSLLPGLSWIYTLGPQPVGGHNLTLLRMGGRAGDWRVSHGASTRIVVDFGQPDRLLAVLPGGQSGQPRSPHYGDHHAPYLSGELLPIPLTPEGVRAAGASVLTLAP